MRLDDGTHDLARSDGRLRAVHLAFAEAHAASSRRRCDDAIRFARTLADRAPADAETLGLLALLLLTDGRAADGTAALERALAVGDPGPYQLRAAIAALRTGQVGWSTAEWSQIAALFAELEFVDPSPVVTINRAVAVAQAEGSGAGLAVLAPLAGDERLARYQPLHAARAELLRSAGDTEGARDAYRQAIDLADNAPERAVLQQRAATVTSAPDRTVTRR